MADEPRVPQLTADMSQSLMLLRASHNLYRSLLDALRQNTDELGDPDLPNLFRPLNEALTGHFPNRRGRESRLRSQSIKTQSIDPCWTG